MSRMRGAGRARRLVASILGLALAAATLVGCAREEAVLTELNIDYATYSPLSLVIRDQGWLEDELADEGVTVNWVFSSGSNKANENLRAHTVDIATTGGAPAVQSRANGTPIKTLFLAHTSDGFAFVVPDGSPITSVEQLRGGSIAATRGTDAYYFALQALAEHGIGEGEVSLQNLQHADGRAAMLNGSVDAWSGIDPILAGAELAGAHILYTNPSLISPIVVNANESFIDAHPDTVQLVTDVYERAREWTIAHPDEATAIYAEAAGVDPEVAALAFSRFDFTIDPVPDAAALEPVLTAIGNYMIDAGDVVSREAYDEALATIYDSRFIVAATSPTTSPTP